MARSMFPHLENQLAHPFYCFRCLFTELFCRYSSHFCLFVPLPRKQPDAGLVVSPSSDMQHLRICHLHTHVLQVLVLIMALPALDEVKLGHISMRDQMVLHPCYSEWRVLHQSIWLKPHLYTHRNETGGFFTTSVLLNRLGQGAEFNARPLC